MRQPALAPESVAVDRPLVFLGRCGTAFVEIVLAVVVIGGAVVVGHDLRQFRDWYGDPGTTHLWAPTPAPSPLAEPLR